MPVLDALMTGMTTDTNNFANSVFPSTLQMASELLAAGVDRNALLGHLYQNYRENRFRAMGAVLAERMVVRPDGVAYIILDRAFLQRFDIQEGETEGFVNLPLGIGGVRISLLLREDEGHFRVSIRSKAGVSANRLATEVFHGGGHEQAAGGKLHFPQDIATPADAEKFVSDVTARFMRNQ
jgi:phosphoesterase RecJ-like protein